MNTYEESLYNI